MISYIMNIIQQFLEVKWVDIDRCLRCIFKRKKKIVRKIGKKLKKKKNCNIYSVIYLYKNKLDIF